MVLIEAYSEFIEALMTPEQWQALVTFNVDYGTDTVNPIPGYGDMETIPYGSMNQELRDTAPLGDLPLAVMSHGVPFEIDTVPEAFTSAAQLEDFLTSANEQQATLAPDGRYWLAETSGHYVHQDQPELVIEAIRQVVTGVRDPDTGHRWNPAVRTRLARCVEVLVGGALGPRPDPEPPPAATRSATQASDGHGHCGGIPGALSLSVSAIRWHKSTRTARRIGCSVSEMVQPVEKLPTQPFERRLRDCRAPDEASKPCNSAQ